MSCRFPNWTVKRADKIHKEKARESVPVLVPPFEALALPWKSERATQDDPRRYAI